MIRYKTLRVSQTLKVFRGGEKVTREEIRLTALTSAAG